MFYLFISLTLKVWLAVVHCELNSDQHPRFLITTFETCTCTEYGSRLCSAECYLCTIYDNIWSLHCPTCSFFNDRQQHQFILARLVFGRRPKDGCEHCLGKAAPAITLHSSSLWRLFAKCLFSLFSVGGAHLRFHLLCLRLCRHVFRHVLILYEGIREMLHRLCF